MSLTGPWRLVQVAERGQAELGEKKSKKKNIAPVDSGVEPPSELSAFQRSKK